jgi:pimeloyl-ACP methyl ester carboxylesterase
VNRPRTRARRGERVCAGALALLALAPLALTAWRAERVPALIARAAGYAAPSGLRWFDPADASWTTAAPRDPGHAVLLVHGLDEPGCIWDQLAPALADAGRPVLRFDYPNDQPAAASADGLAAALADLARAGVRSVDVVAHSMGGLLARDVLSRAPDQRPPRAPRVPLLITLGTPHNGSPWAGLQPVAEVREHVQRWIESDDRAPARLFAAWHDGLGQARADLTPGSEYLTDLNARAWPTDTRLVCVVALVRPLPVGHAASAANLPEAAELLGVLPDSVLNLGDGVVPAASAACDGASEILFVHANHRSLVRTVEFEAWARTRLGAAPAPTPPAIPLVLERLSPTGGLVGGQ